MPAPLSIQDLQIHQQALQGMCVAIGPHGAPPLLLPQGTPLPGEHVKISVYICLAACNLSGLASPEPAAAGKLDTAECTGLHAFQSLRLLVRERSVQITIQRVGTGRAGWKYLHAP